MAEAYRVADSITYGRVTIDVLEWTSLTGITDPRALELLFFMRQGNMPIRQVRLRVDMDHVVVEGGALQFHDGRFDVDTQLQGSRVVRRLLGRQVSGEGMFHQRYRGKGWVWLEPSFQNYLIVGLDNEGIVVDQGMFMCAVGDVEVTGVAQRNISAAIFGGEGLFQTKISGKGVVVLESPVGTAEIEKINLTAGRKVQVDGNFVLLRGATVNFSVQKSARTLLGTLTTGEGLLQTFEGEGEVWVAPLIPVYEALSAINPVVQTPGAR